MEITKHKSFLISLGGINIKVDGISTYSVAPILKFDGQEWYIFKSRDEACQAARDYREDMAHNDPSEFATMVGERTLVSWALGQWAGPGNEGATSLDGWLDIVYERPEKEFGSWDGTEWDVEAMSRALLEELGFDETDQPIMYRCN